MSFSIPATVSGDNFTTELDAEVEKYADANAANLNPGARELISAGVRAAAAIAETLGSKVEQLNVTLSGHGNDPAHQHVEGYADEALSVSVSVTAYKAEAETPPA